MNMRLPTSVLATTLALIPPGVTYGHHGVAAYDRESSIALDGTVIEFAWANPHALIHVESVDADGNAQRWVVETAGPVILARAGWSQEILQPGMPCRIVGHPARNGSHTMILERVILADGKVLGSYIP